MAKEIYAQGNTFNKMYNNRQQNEAYSDPKINLSDSTYLVFEGSSGDASRYDSSYWTNGIRFLKIDRNGNVLNNDAHLFYHPYVSAAAVEITNHDQKTDNRYVQISYMGITPFHTRVFEHYIGAVSSNGDSLWFNKLMVQSDTNIINSVIKYNNYYYTYGTPTPSAGPLFFLAKYDSTGQRLFYKIFDDDVEPMRMELIGVNRLLMTGLHSYYYSKDDILDRKPWYMITDTAGNVLFEKKYRDPLNNLKYMTGIHKVNNNCFLIDGYKRFRVGNSTIFYLMDTLGKISSERSIPLEYGAYNLVVLDDNTFVAAGNDKKDSITFGKIIKADTAGNVIWQREYYTSYYKSLFFGIAKGLNNGFVITGVGTDTTRKSGIADAWLIVTDSLGCVTPGCQLTNYVQEISKLKLDYLQCWPNPVADLLKCKLHPSLNALDCSLLIIDGCGKELIKVSLVENNFDLDVSNLPFGFYFVMLIKNNKLLASSKILKQ
ncbi:MAG: T9SS type A sorting domain-containing protein [Bacteroidia bacterium]|nr:T9SS type A sorting domain-containing protein [Bacteroidia bacterium]